MVMNSQSCHCKSVTFMSRCCAVVSALRSAAQHRSNFHGMDHSMVSGRCLDCPQKGGPTEHHLHNLSHPEPLSGELSSAWTSLMSNLAKHCSSSTRLHVCLGRRTVFSLIESADGIANLLATLFCSKSSTHIEGRFKKHSMDSGIHSKASPETLASIWKLFQ